MSARKRYCAECKLNVYNLSEMTKHEAETLLINSEGRLCVRFYRRADGTILIQNCPVGWAKVKQRVSKIATAAFSLVAGFFGATFAFNISNVVKEIDTSAPMIEVENDSQMKKDKPGPSFGGPVSNSNEIIELIFGNR